MHLSILDVGHGNAAVLTDGGKVAVFDGGRGKALCEFLIQENISHIDLVIISHADEDHIDGLIALAVTQKFTIGKVRLNTDSLKTTGAWNDLLIEIGNLAADFSPALTSDSKEDLIVGNVKVEVLAPTGYLAAKGPGGNDKLGQKLTSNSISAVIRLRTNGVGRVMLAGDIDDVGLSNLLALCTDIQSPVLVFPHHGGKSGGNSMNSFVKSLCDSVKPETVIFSVGRNRTGFPRPEVLSQLLKTIPDLRIACTQLAKICSQKPPSIVAAHLDDKYAAGRADNFCCAGTIVVDCHEDLVSISPDINQHRIFIKTHVETPHCITKS